MSKANDQVQDLQIANQHLIERYKNEVTGTMLIFFRRMETLINKEIKVFYDDGKLSVSDKNALKRNLTKIQETELNKIHKQIMNESYKFLGSQAKIYEGQLKKILEDMSDYLKVKSVSEKVLKKSFDKEPISMDKGEITTLIALWDTFFLNVKNTLDQNLDSAFDLRKSTQELTRDINKEYKKDETKLKAVIAVIIQQAYGVAMQSVNGVNGEFIRGYMWQSVLDGRTSPFCREHAGQYWLYDYPERSTLPWEIYAPAHYRCRTSNPPIMKSYRELGIPASDLTKSQKDLLANSKVEATTYYEWFERQPDSVKKEILGPVRFNAYQSGGIAVTDFYSRDGRKLTLKQLQEKTGKINEEYMRYISE